MIQTCHGPRVRIQILRPKLSSWPFYHIMLRWWPASENANENLAYGIIKSVFQETKAQKTVLQSCLLFEKMSKKDGAFQYEVYLFTTRLTCHTYSMKEQGQFCHVILVACDFNKSSHCLCVHLNVSNSCRRESQLNINNVTPDTYAAFVMCSA